MTLPDRAMRDRIIALALLGLLLLGFWFGPVSAYVDLLQSGADEIDQKMALLQRYRVLATSAPRLETTGPASADASILMPDLPEAQAVARLQETLKTAAAAAQIQIRGFQVMRNEPLPGAIRFGVRIRGSGDAAGLGQLLYAIAEARPLLVTDNLQVQSRAAAPAAAAVPLEFQLDVYGFRPGTPS